MSVYTHAFPAITGRKARPDAAGGSLAYTHLLWHMYTLTHTHEHTYAYGGRGKVYESTYITDPEGAADHDRTRRARLSLTAFPCPAHSYVWDLLAGDDVFYGF